MSNGPTTILDRLEGVKPSGRNQWTAKCPTHNDRKPSLSVGVGDDGKVLLLTGLRKAELASLTVGQLAFDRRQPYVELLAKDEKAGRGATIPLRADLVADLREHLAGNLRLVQEAALKDQQPVPARLPAATPLFNVPKNFIKIFDRDLAAAGIPKRDERGRTVDVHALRHTFGTHLSLAGVPPRVAQAAMRHSSIHLTMNVYTDPALLDVAWAVEALPALEPAVAAGRRVVGRAD